MTGQDHLNSRLQPRVALITGVAGQDGSYLAERLVAEGWVVHGLVRSMTDLCRAPAGVTVHVGDLAAAPDVRRLMLSLAPNTVFNLGGITSVARSWESPQETARVTGGAVNTLLEAAWDLQESLGSVVRLVQASSSEIFGEPTRSPQDADANCSRESVRRGKGRGPSRRGRVAPSGCPREHRHLVQPRVTSEKP